MDIGALPPVDRNVEGVVEMMLDATQKYDEPLTDERLFGWHAALFPTGHSGMRRITVGAWRNDADGPMQVVSGPVGKEKIHFEAPPAAKVPAEIKQFLACIFTLSSHHPYRLPPADAERFATDGPPILTTLRYTDHALRGFFGCCRAGKRAH